MGVREYGENGRLRATSLCIEVSKYLSVEVIN
jgi:hypothetical protein